jgi:FOG: TPR repeat, SEL1 subfamily
MATRKELKALAALEASGELYEAFIKAMALLGRDHGDETGQVFAVLERCAEHFPDAAVDAAMSYRVFDRKEAKPGTIVTLYELAIAGDNTRIRAMATHGLAKHLIHTGEDIDRGIKLMKMSLHLGYPNAAAELGSYYEHGKFGLPTDSKKAVDLYVEATEGGSAEGMYKLANYMLSNTVAVGTYHPLELIKRAAELGHPEAAGLITKLAEMVSAAEEAEVDEILPYVIVPDGLSRMEQARAAIVNEFSVGSEQAAECVAALMGYPSWKMMDEAVQSKKAPGKFDEDCSAVEFNERERLQTDVFARKMRVDETTALTAVKLLRPSSRIVQPSLRRLDEIMEGGIGGAADLEEAITEFLEHAGLPTDLSASPFRIVWPLQAKLWLDLFESHGWTMRRRRNDASGDGDQIAVTETTDGRLFKVFMSGVSYEPGDLGDTHVENVMGTITKACECAVLIFNHPRISTIRGSEHAAALYGGKILNNGIWADFVLRPADGIDDALRQHEKRINLLSPKEVSEYAFEGAIKLACRISGHVFQQEDCKQFGLLQGATNWSSPMPKIAIEAMELMREIGPHLGRS